MFKYPKYYLFAAGILLFFVALFLPQNAKAEESFYFHGYAWSSNIGWIDMSGVKYTVVDNFTPVIFEAYQTNAGQNFGHFGYAALSGYAWASGVDSASGTASGPGWISFNEVQNCPPAWSPYYITIIPSTCTPRINLSDDSPTGNIGNELNGFAKILSYANDGEDPGNNWADGWISLGAFLSNPDANNIIAKDNVDVRCHVSRWNHNDSNIPIGILPPLNGECDGYAWGGNVTGWIDFSNVTLDILPEPTITLYANGQSGQISINAGDPLVLSWNGNNLCEGSNCASIKYYFNNVLANFPSGVNGLSASSLPVPMDSLPLTNTFVVNHVGVHHFVIKAISKYSQWASWSPSILDGVGGVIFSDVFVYVGVEPPAISLGQECVEGNSTQGKLILNTTLPYGTPCQGNTPWSAVPGASATSGLVSVSPPIYTISCGGVNASLNLSCTGIGPNGNGQNKNPKYKEN